MKFRARIKYLRAHEHRWQMWRCLHEHRSPDTAAQCGSAQVRRITAGHNVVALDYAVLTWPSQD